MTTEVGVRRVALLGNPNTGKTTLFNALTGLRHRVGNYPGVTVELKTGRMGSDVEVVDLPGTYSLAAFSPDEALAVRALLGEIEGEARPDLAVVVVDATNLERNLYLFTQVVETGIATVVALNMADLARSASIEIDVERLSERLGVPVVPVAASKGEGIEQLAKAIRDGDAQTAAEPAWTWPEAVEEEAERLDPILGTPRALTRRALVDAEGVIEDRLVREHGEKVCEELGASRTRVEDLAGEDPAALEARMRYTFIDSAVADAVKRAPRGPSITDRLDAILTHRLFGTLIFVVLMAVVFMSIFEWAGPLMDLIDEGFGAVGAWVASLFAGTSLEGGLLESLLMDGVVAGVGGILIFLPQILILFLFIALLEDCGYLARAAFLMDRLLRFCGLSGHAFIPLLSSFACAIPGIMAARTIRDRKDRLATVLVAPLMTCSARLPVYALLIAAFVPPVTVAGFLPLEGLVLAAMYFLGIFAAAAVAFLLRKTLLRGPASTFVLELPPYRMPSLRTVSLRLFERGKAFVVRAGTIIFAMSIVVWALGYFPHSEDVGAHFEGERTAAETTLAGEALEAQLAEIDAEEAGEYLRTSYLGSMGRAVEPVVAPLGWDWKIGMATLASFPAREVVVSTLSIIYDLGDEGAEEEATMIGSLRAAKHEDGRQVFSLAVALSLMVFFALCCQCGATVATIKRETNSRGWAAFAFFYMTALGYVAAWITYAVASGFGGA